MKVIAPTPYRSFSQVLYTNVPLSKYPLWSATTAYAAQAQVYFGDYEYVAITGSTGVNPSIPAESPVWFKTGVVNRLRPFDLVISNQMEAATGTASMDVRMTLTSLADQVVLFGVVGASVRIRVLDTQGAEIATETRAFPMIDNSQIISWHGYFFDPINALNELLIEDVAGYPGHTIEITIYAPNGTARLGQAVVGLGREIGVLQEGTGVGIQDYSRKERDEWGNPMVVERPFSLRGEYDLALSTDQVRNIRSLLAGLRATPAVYVEPGPAYDMGTMIYGYYQDFSINLSVGQTSFMTLEVEGLV